MNALLKRFEEIERLMNECSGYLSDETGYSSAPAAKDAFDSRADGSRPDGVGTRDQARRRSETFRTTNSQSHITSLLDEVGRRLKQIEIEQLFIGKYDKQSAIVSIFSGAGGQDAEDWAAMLAEMYINFSERRNWKTKIIHETFGDFQSKTGRHPVKNITFEIKGDYAYGYLKKEAGVHRLVRISPFSSEKKRHTSFALVEILPDVGDLKGELKIPEDDLKVEFFRSSGPGGQNVNKVETAVRITHLPTGLAVVSQAGRSQSQNRERALQILKAKLIKLMEENKVKELNQLRIKVKPEWSNQIRSYVLQPYKLVKDHRTNIETSRVDEVLDGNIDLFIEDDIMRK